MNWISIEEKIPDVSSGKFRVKRQNGIEINAFFYQDKISWIAFYGKKTSYWWDSKRNHDRLDDVTHWMPLPKTTKSE